MPVRLEVGHVLRHVSAREDATVDCRVKRDDAVTEHLGEAGQLLERDDGDPLVGKQRGGAAARERARTRAGAAPGRRLRSRSCRRRRGAPVLMPRSAPARPRAAAGAPRAWIRACSVSGVSPGKTGTASCRRTRARVDALRRRGGPWRPSPSTPAASASSTAWAPGKAGSRAGCTFTTLSGNLDRNVSRKRCM